jgi:hypothetical protein
VSRGRLVVDEATSLPDGEVELLVVDDEEEEWPTELDGVLADRIAQLDRGELIDAAESLARLRAR